MNDTLLTVALFVLITISSCDLLLSIILNAKRKVLEEKFHLENLHLSNKMRLIFTIMSAAMINDKVFSNDMVFSTLHLDDDDIDKISIVISKFIRDNNLEDHASVEIYRKLQLLKTKNQTTGRELPL